MAKLYLLIGVLSLSIFTYGQYRGVGLFDEVVDSTSARSIGNRNTFHK